MFRLMEASEFVELGWGIKVCGFFLSSRCSFEFIIILDEVII